MKRGIPYFVLLLLWTSFKAQPFANLVNNGSFGEKYNCSNPFILEKAVGWSSIDSSSFSGGYMHFCNNAVPSNVNTFQYPRSDSAYILSNFYNKTYSIRGYLKNRLKSSLISGRTYCVRFYVNICNTSPRGIDGFAAYFGDSSIDTITKTTIPLTFITPQVNNPPGNVITDTLNWVPITGTFVANGTEKYMLIGNFLSDNATQTASINTPYFPEEWTDVCIDDVSCIEMDVAAYAGPDRWLLPGDSVYIGRENDWAIDPYCQWYRLPDMTNAIDTISGMWVKPTTTTTYVVRQELECNSVKWDTVVVYQDAVGLEKLRQLKDELLIVPQPANDMISLILPNTKLAKYFQHFEIIDVKGRVIKELAIADSETTLSITISDLASGVYVLRLSDTNKELVITKKLCVQR